jgi:hypothetical protein
MRLLAIASLLIPEIYTVHIPEHLTQVHPWALKIYTGAYSQTLKIH